MKLLVTGVSGFIGSRLAAFLRGRGDEVVGTYCGDRPQLPGVEVYAVDLLDGAALRRLVHEADPAAIVHLAGLSHVGASWGDPAAYFQVNVLGTEEVLEAAAGRRVVVASSAEVYGTVPAEEQPIGEDRRLAPVSPYGLTKAAAERLAVTRGAVVARIFNLIGPGQAATFALPAFARQLLAIRRGEREAVLTVGNLSPRRDFVHVEDGARAFALLAEKGEPGRAYNIASGQALAIEEALQLLSAIAGVEARVEVDPDRLRKVDVPLLAGDPSRLEGLGWRRRRSVREALKELWASVAGG